MSESLKSPNQLFPDYKGVSSYYSCNQGFPSVSSKGHKLPEHHNETKGVGRISITSGASSLQLVSGFVGVASWWSESCEGCWKNPSRVSCLPFPLLFWREEILTPEDEPRHCTNSQFTNIYCEHTEHLMDF